MSEESNKLEKKSLGRSLYSTTAGILLSRISGLARDILSAWYWGATGVAQAAYNTAFAFPNNLRALFGEGAFSSAFVPMMSEHISKDEKDAAWKLASRAITLQLLVLLAIVAVISIGAGIAGFRFVFANETAQTTLQIMPMVMPYAVFVCVAGALSAMLNSLHSFFLPAIVQVIFNAVQIGTIILLYFGWKNDNPTALWIFCGSTIVAGILQDLALIWACRRYGYRYRFDLALRDVEVRALCMRILPGLIGAGVVQLNNVIDKVLAVKLGPEAVGALNFSHRLIYLPVGLFGVAMGMVALPALSRAQAQDDRQGVCECQNYALRTILFLALPCTAFLLICGDEVIAFLFQRGAFVEAATQETNYALCYYLIGLPAFCCLKVAVNPFFARKDTRTPMVIGLGCMVVNLILNLSLMWSMRQAGLALASSISSWLNIILLFVFNRKYLPEWSAIPTIKSAVVLCLASALAALAGAGTLKGIYSLDFIERMPLTTGLGVLVFACLGTCAVVYLFACVAFRRPEPRELFGALRRRGKK